MTTEPMTHKQAVLALAVFAAAAVVAGRIGWALLWKGTR